MDTLKEVKSQVAESFGRRLNLLRRRKEISMDELALAVGSTKSAISRYENGLVAPTLDTAQKFADYFMVTVDWLGGGGDDDEIMSSVPQRYIDVVKYAMGKNITADQLKEAIDFMLKMKG